MERNALTSFAKEASKYDPDGIDLLAFGQKVTPHLGVTAENAEKIIGGLKANEMQTNTHLVLLEAYKLHKAGGYEQTVAFVVTDGAPSDPEAVKEVIRTIASEIKQKGEFLSRS